MDRAQKTQIFSAGPKRGSLKCTGKRQEVPPSCNPASQCCMQCSILFVAVQLLDRPEGFSEVLGPLSGHSGTSERTPCLGELVTECTSQRSPRTLSEPLSECHFLLELRVLLPLIVSPQIPTRNVAGVGFRGVGF